MGKYMKPFRKAFRGNVRQKVAMEFVKGKTLDVGFANEPIPFFLDEAKITGFDIQKVRCPSNYETVVQGDAKDLKKHFKKKSFDTILALELIEHLQYFIDFLESCNELLVPGGKLIISTPTPYYYMTILGNVFRPYGKSQIKGHLCLHAPRTLNNVAEQAGFKLLEIKAGSKVYIPFLTWQLVYVYKKLGGGA